MNFPDAIKSGFRRYVTFSGRASRSEFWYFWLFQFLLQVLVLIAVVLATIASMKAAIPALVIGINILFELFKLAILVPCVSVTVRRLHDKDRSGWWLLMPFAPTLLPLITILINIATGAVKITRTAENHFTFSGPHIIDSMFSVAAFLTLCVSIPFLVWLCTRGTSGPNRFGTDPLKKVES